MERRATEGDNRPHSEHRVPWTKGGGHRLAQCVHPGALLQEVNVHGKADRHMRLLTIETESMLNTLWDQEECNQFCSKEELWEAAREEEMKIPWQAANEGQPYRKSSIKKDSGGGDWMELDWTRQLKSS
jgi:hypothetical protein